MEDAVSYPDYILSPGGTPAGMQVVEQRRSSCREGVKENT